MKPYQRVVSRYMKAKHQKGNITIEVVTNHAKLSRNANLAVELQQDGEFKGVCEAYVDTYTLEEMGKGYFACYDDIEKLSEEYWFEHEMLRYDDNGDPVVLVVEVVNSYLHPDLQGQRCGVQMYVELVKEAFLENGRLPLLFMPNYCHNKSTSNQALRVWKSFAKKYHSEGDVIVIDKTPHL